MTRIDTTALSSADKEAIAAATTANAEGVKLEDAYIAMADAIRAYNSQLETAKAAFETAGRKIVSARDAADALANQTGNFPEPVPEPAPWPEVPLTRRKK